MAKKAKAKKGHMQRPLSPYMGSHSPQSYNLLISLYFIYKYNNYIYIYYNSIIYTFVSCMSRISSWAFVTSTQLHKMRLKHVHAFDFGGSIFALAPSFSLKAL